MRRSPITEPAWTLWKPRLVAIPLVCSIFVVSLLLAPLALLLTAVYDLSTRSGAAASRCYLFFVFFFFMEVAGVCLAVLSWLELKVLRAGEARFLRRNFDLQKWWTHGLYRGSERIFGFSTQVRGLESILGGPIIVLMRHISTADTLLPVVLVGRALNLHLRYVLKSELLWDPCLNLVGARLGSCFVRRGSEDSQGQVERVKQLLVDLDSDEGVLIYPEGTRFTPAKQQRVLEKMVSRGETALAERAQRLKHLLPPRLGGTLALLENNPGCAVVFCAHSGLDGVRSIKDMLRGALMGRRVEVELWTVPFDQLPTERDALVAWLFDQWEVLDGWVAVRASAV